MGLLELARRTAADLTAIGIVVANVIASALALSLPPILISVLLLYWAECAVIGVLNAFKLWFIHEEDVTDVGLGWKIVILSFCSVHYFIFLFVLFLMLLLLGGAELSLRGVDWRAFDWREYFQVFVPAVACIAAAHVWSFFRNFIGQREYEGRSLWEQNFRPYRRVIAMYGVVWVAAFVVALTRLPELALALFLPLKIVADLDAHFRDHQNKKQKPAETEKSERELRLL